MKRTFGGTAGGSAPKNSFVFVKKTPKFLEKMAQNVSASNPAPTTLADKRREAMKDDEEPEEDDDDEYAPTYVFADDEQQAEAILVPPEKRIKLQEKTSGCPNKSNQFHNCTQWCIDHWGTQTNVDEIEALLERKKEEKIQKQKEEQAAKEIEDTEEEEVLGDDTRILFRKPKKKKKYKHSNIHEY